MDGGGRGIHVCRTTAPVMAGWMSLGVVVSEVMFTGSPGDGVVAESDTIADPVIAHVDGFGALETDGVCRNSLGGGVVCDERSGALWVPEVRKG